MAAAVGAVAAAVALTGCGGPGVTRARVEDAVGPAFAHLWDRQQQLLGVQPGPGTQASAACHRTSGSSQGAGDDWVCQVLLQAGGRPASTYTYELNVKADGCYVADGPPGLIGGTTLTTPKGATRVNPLFAFDGCFDT